MFDDVKHLSIVAFGSAVVGYGHISSSAGPDELRQASLIRENLVSERVRESLDGVRADYYAAGILPLSRLPRWALPSFAFDDVV